MIPYFGLPRSLRFREVYNSINSSKLGICNLNTESAFQPMSVPSAYTVLTNR